VTGRLWAGWRSAYVESAAGQPDGCVLCAITGSGADDADVIWRGTTCAAVLNAYPYTSGHLMVMPTRHVGELELLTAEETAELWAAVTDAVVALKAAYRPGGINVGANLGRAAGAGVPGHLHIHALPRWDGDTNFMTSVAETRVLPEALPDSLAKLRAAWPSGSVG
jgi:ATP adenylyltransferase